MFPFIIADFGNIIGGLATQWIIKKGVPIPKARKIGAGFFGSIMVFSLIFGPLVIDGPYSALVVLALAGFGYASCSANMLAFPADVVPLSATASVWGVASVGSGLGGAIFQSLSGITVKNLSAKFDYSTAGAYFITVCTQNRVCIFGEISCFHMRYLLGESALQRIARFVRLWMETHQQ